MGTSILNSQRHDLYPTKLDIRNRGGVDKLVKNISPDVVIHTAALTNVDYCETNKREAWDVNVEGTRNIAEASRLVNSKMVYISTDYVFDGEQGMYREYDRPNPLNHYGETKYEGEKVVQELCSDYLIARPSVLYGWHPKPNFVTWVIKELRQGHEINIVRDQFNSPTLVDNLVDLILKLIERGETGVYHTSGSERINRFKFTLKIADAFNLDRNLINPVTPDELNWVAERPRDSSLDISKMSVIKKPLNIKKSLKVMRKQE